MGKSADFSRVSFMNVLVTGGMGFIGLRLVRKLLELGLSVKVVDNLSCGVFDDNPVNENQFEFHLCDITNYEKLNSIFENVDSVIHLAALVSLDECARSPTKAYEVNVKGTLNLLNISVNQHVNRFLHVSSSAVFGEPAELPLKEDSSTRPISFYGVTKLEAERLVMDYNTRRGLHSTILRPFNVYGPGKRMSSYTDVISQFVWRISQDMPLVIYGDGFQTRDFIYIDDVVKAIILALEHNTEDVFNIASGTPTTINNLSSIILRLCGKQNLPVIHVDPRQGDVKHSWASIDKAYKYLGFKPFFTLEKGLEAYLKMPVV